jgi:hypothetical protein
MAGYAFGSNPPDGLTQKPTAHFCRRVLGGAIDFEQNTLFHWTSQTKIEVFSHRGRGKDRPSMGWVSPGPCAQIEIRDRTLIYVGRPALCELTSHIASGAKTAVIGSRVVLLRFIRRAARLLQHSRHRGVASGEISNCRALNRIINLI